MSLWGWIKNASIGKPKNKKEWRWALYLLIVWNDMKFLQNISLDEDIMIYIFNLLRSDENQFDHFVLFVRLSNSYIESF